MSSKPEIFAVIWQDFIPLWLPCRDASDAKAQAKAMRDRMRAAGRGDMAATVEAVRLAAGSDTLEFLRTGETIKSAT